MICFIIRREYAIRYFVAHENTFSLWISSEHCPRIRLEVTESVLQNHTIRFEIFSVFRKWYFNLQCPVNIPVRTLRLFFDYCMQSSKRFGLYKSKFLHISSLARTKIIRTLLFSPSMLSLIAVKIKLKIVNDNTS